MNAEVERLRRKSKRHRVIKQTNGQVHPREGALFFPRVADIPHLFQIFSGAKGIFTQLDKAWKSLLSLRGRSQGDIGFHL